MTTNVQDNSLTISGTISRDSGFYTCVVTNGLDEERASAILTVKGKNKLLFDGGRHGRDRMVVGFTTTYTVSAYHH